MRNRHENTPRGSHAQHASHAPRSASSDSGRDSISRLEANRRAVSSRGGQGLDPAENPYSRRAAQGDYAKQRKSKKRRRIVLVVCAAILAALLTGGGVAFAYFKQIEGNLHDGVDSNLLSQLKDTQYAGDPFYMLLMGTDGSEERSESAEYAGDQFRSDSMILARIDPQQKQVSLISLHRDTLIDMGKNGKQKLNAAHSIGGAAYTVEVVSKFAGVDISHYAEIDFDGFKEAVDALGGVEVDVPMEINDADAGGHLDKGLQTLNGDQALILCRARNAYNDYGDGDRYRAANQRLVLSAIAKKILSSDPVTMVNTVNALSKYITTDFDLSEIVSLANNMRGMDTQASIYSAMEPTTSKYENSTWYEFVDETAWKTMMSRVDQGLPPTTEDEVDARSGTVLASTGDASGKQASSSSTSSTTSTAVKRSGTVSVKNGAGIDGAAAEAASKIDQLGYTAEAGNAGSSNFTTTVVVYSDASQKDAAQEIANLLGKGVVTQNNGTYSFTSDFLVVIGSDWV